MRDLLKKKKIVFAAHVVDNSYDINKDFDDGNADNNYDIDDEGDDNEDDN